MIMRARVTKVDTTPKSYQAQLKSKAKVGYVNKLIGDVLSLWLVLTINYQSAKAKRNRRQAEGHDEAKGNAKKQSVQKKSYRCKNGSNCTAKVPVEVRKDKARRDRRDEGMIKRQRQNKKPPLSKLLSRIGCKMTKCIKPMLPRDFSRTRIKNMFEKYFPTLKLPHINNTKV